MPLMTHQHEGPTRPHLINLTRRGVFLVGLSSGAFVAAKGRTILKGGIKIAVRSGFKLRQVAARSAENLSDVVAEAVSELDADKPS
jgi:hypothetical protein